MVFTRGFVETVDWSERNPRNSSAVPRSMLSTIEDRTSGERMTKNALSLEINPARIGAPRASCATNIWLMRSGNCSRKCSVNSNTRTSEGESPARCKNLMRSGSWMEVKNRRQRAEGRRRDVENERLNHYSTNGLYSFKVQLLTTQTSEISHDAPNQESS